MALHLSDAEEHARFQKSLKESQPSVRTVSCWFRDLGYDFLIPGHTVANKHADWKEHSDDGDLWIRKKGLTEREDWLRIEVKRITRNFTCSGDWYKHFGGHFIVDSKGKYNRKSSTPYAYVVCSHDMTHVGVMKVAETRKGWYLRMLRDSTAKDPEKKPFYNCKLEFVVFYKLPKQEKGQ